jgi:hypothetical protein
MISILFVVSSLWFVVLGEPCRTIFVRIKQGRHKPYTANHEHKKPSQE